MTMKKILFIAAIIMASVSSAFAQNEAGEMAGGINILYGTEVGNIGVGAKYRYSLTEEFRAEAALDYIFKKDHENMLSGNVNIQYLLPIEDSKMTIYPMLGLALGNSHECHYSKEGILIEEKTNTGIAGINAGCGVEFEITDKASVTLEAKYQFFNKHCTQLLLGVGLVHKF